MTPASKKTSVAIYARFSTDRQDARSIDDQVRRCRGYADKQGLTVVAEYADEAESGAHMERAEMQRMMTDAQSGGARFSAVLVDDLSRLSRDIWDMGNLVFRHLAAVGITLIDVNTGMASDNVAARTTFAALGIANDAFLQLVRTETHRGLEGRAISGFATGGRVFGYSSEKEKDPPDKDHPRSVYIINPEQADVVRRVFKLYAEGLGQRAIASMLNAEKVPAPYDKSHKNKTGLGWGHSTVRAMLRNPRYIGEWRWNVRQWVRVPGKKSKRALRRDDAEVTKKTYPHLAIIDAELWARVQRKFTDRKNPKKGRPPGAGKIPHALSGYLHCGVCGNSMHIVSSVTKKDRRYVNYGCSARDSKGPNACSNRMTVSELTAIRDVFAEVKRRLKDPKLVDEFLKGYAEQAMVRQRRGSHDPAVRLRSQLQEKQRRVDRLADAVAKAGWSDALGKQLRDEETELAQLQSELEQVVEIQAPTHAPSEAWLRKYFDNLILLTEAAPTRGRQALQGWFGPVKVIPVGDGPDAHYEAEGQIRVDPAILADSGVVLDKTSCGGRI